MYAKGRTVSASANIDLNVFMGFAESGRRHTGYLFEHSVKAVSYTHLDVYKRQASEPADRLADREQRPTRKRLDVYKRQEESGCTGSRI